MQRRFIFSALITTIAAVMSMPAMAVPTNDCVIKQFVTAKQMEGLDPKDIGTDFTATDTRVVVLARLDCTTIAEKEIVTFRWLADGKEVARSKAGLAISRNWRIWSQARIKPGAWTVELIDGEGQVLVAEKFTVRDAPAQPQTQSQN